MSQGPSIDDLRAEVTRMLNSLDPETPIAATVVFHVKRPREETFVRNAEALTEATLRLPGVNVFAYHKRKPTQPEQGYGDSVEYLIYEDWETVRQFRRQWDSEHLKKFQYSVLELLAGPPDLTFYRGWREGGGGGDGGGKTHVPKTGQTKCWDTSEHHIHCAGTGQDGEVRAGAPWPDPRFTDNGDGTVTDNLTGLVWLKDGNAFGTRTWHQALEDCRSLHNGKCGLTDGSQPGDWRLPNIHELRSLEDYGQHTPALPSDHPFTNVRQSLCWSSTTVASAPNLARFLFVGIGSCVWDHKHVLMGVWPVKGGLHAE